MLIYHQFSFTHTHAYIIGCLYLFVSGVCVKDRWRELHQRILPHTDDHVLLFNDLHFLMASLGSKETHAPHRLVEGLRDLAR